MYVKRRELRITLAIQCDMRNTDGHQVDIPNLRVHVAFDASGALDCYFPFPGYPTG